jgi:glutathione-specific gamma-glutamylcyclotransferase
MDLRDFREQIPQSGLWVFAYGSLMWSPGFPFRERLLARVHGYHRALCILSTRYRGTDRRPGLVMGLCQGGSCWGVAYRIADSQVLGTLRRLWNREMPRRVYRPRLVPAQIGRSERRVSALAFIADPSHPAYVRELDLHGRARLVAQGIGERGHCIDYIRYTLEHMHEAGVRDPHLERILHAALKLRGAAHS